MEVFGLEAVMVVIFMLEVKLDRVIAICWLLTLAELWTVVPAQACGSRRIRADWTFLLKETGAKTEHFKQGVNSGAAVVYSTRKNNLTIKTCKLQVDPHK